MMPMKAVAHVRAFMTSEAYSLCYVFLVPVRPAAATLSAPPPLLAVPPPASSSSRTSGLDLLLPPLSLHAGFPFWLTLCWNRHCSGTASHCRCSCPTARCESVELYFLCG